MDSPLMESLNLSGHGLSRQSLTSLRRSELDLEAAIREHQTTTAFLVAVGVVVGVALAAWTLSRPPRDRVGAEDPEAPLFI